MTQTSSKLTSSPTPSDVRSKELSSDDISATNPFVMPQVPCALCLDAASKPTPPYEPNVSSLTGRAPHPTDLVKPDIQGGFFCVTAGTQVGIVSNQSV